MTTTAIKQKWFYGAQEKIQDYLDNKFGMNHRCEFQDVCRYNVYENYTAWYPKEIGKHQESFSIQFVIHRPPTARTPGLIRVYFDHYEDTMQFFLK